jgi:hypothetical protein
MKMTLLEIVQDILNDMDSDAVNSIDDTVESQQVAQIVKTCYFGIISNRNWPHLRSLIQLDSLGDLNKPNYLSIPEKVKELKLFKYDITNVGSTTPEFVDVKYKEPDEFLRIVSSRNSSNANVQVVTDTSGVKLLILKDAHPQYWTSFDDNYVVTDAYDAAAGVTLVKDKTQCVAYVSPTWDHTDGAIPNLPEEAFSALLEEAKSTAFLALKQVANQKAEQKAVRQNRWLARKAWRAHGGVRYEDYGRKNRR